MKISMNLTYNYNNQNLKSNSRMSFKQLDYKMLVKYAEKDKIPYAFARLSSEMENLAKKVAENQSISHEQQKVFDTYKVICESPKTYRFDDILNENSNQCVGLYCDNFRVISLPRDECVQKDGWLKDDYDIMRQLLKWVAEKNFRLSGGKAGTDNADFFQLFAKYSNKQ